MKKYRLKNILSHLSIPVFSISILSCATKINDDSQNILAPKTDEKKEEYILEKVEIAKGNNNSFNFKLKIKNSNNSILKKELIDIFYIKENEKNVQKQVLNNSIVESKLNDNILEFSIEELEVNTIYLLSEIKINEKNLILKNHDLTFKIEKEILKVEYFSLEEKRDDIKKLLFRFNINEFTNELIVLKLENVTTKEEIEIKSLIKDDKTALFELDSLLSSDAKELKIVDLYLDKKTEKIIINSKILDYKFTTSTIKGEKIIENDNFVIENIVISDIEKTSAKLILSFSHHDLENESNKTFKIILKEKGSEITKEIVYNDYVSKTNLIEIMLPDLKVGTNYIIDEIKLNDNNLNIETKERNFRTKDKEIEEFSSLELVKDKSNKSNFILAKFDNSIEGNLEDYKFVLSIASKNNLNNIIEISNKIYNPENQGFVFELPNNIKKNNVYLVASIKNKLKNISFNEFEFELTRENYTFIKPKQLVNTNLTRQGNISNPKEIFDFETFPKNVVLEKNQNNETIVKRYFSDSISKLTQEIQGNSSFATEFPKWANFYKDFETRELNPTKFLEMIPDLNVYFKENSNLYKYVNKIMPIFIQDQEIIINENKKEATLTLNINNFLSKPFTNKKIGITLDLKETSRNSWSNSSSISSRINIDLEELLINKNSPSDIWKKEFSISNKIEFNYYIDQNNNLIFNLRIDPNLSSNLHLTDNSNEINSNNIFVSKYNHIIDISYLTLDSEDENFSLSSPIYEDDLSAKLSSNGEFYSKDINNPLRNNTGKRILPSESNLPFDEIRKRVFVVGGGTSTMLSKVKPNDDSDQRYYFITNRHVSDILQNNWSNSQVLKKFLIPSFDDSKVRNADNEISMNVNKDNFVFNFWESSDQTKRDGTKESDARRHADISISIIDIAPILENAKRLNNKLIIDYLENWKNLKALKLSKKTKYIEPNNYVQLYLSSFPLDSHAGFSGRRYREHVINRIEKIQLSDQDQRFIKYGNFRTFIQYDNKQFGLSYDLISGGSGSVVYDENGDMVALFMQNTGDDGYGFGLLASNEYDYFGFETNNNPNSFKNKLTEAIKTNPNRFEMIEI